MIPLPGKKAAGGLFYCLPVLYEMYKDILYFCERDYLW